MISDWGWDDEPKKRTLGIRDKQILYIRAKKRCEACGRKIDFTEMHAAHKNPACKGGSATMRNSVCLCATCNKLQGTDNWATFIKKMGKTKISTVTSSKISKRTKKTKSEKKQRRHNGGILGQPTGYLGSDITERITKKSRQISDDILRPSILLAGNKKSKKPKAKKKRRHSDDDSMFHFDWE